MHADYIARCYPGGSLPARLMSLTFERLRAQMVQLGSDNGEIDDARRLLEDATTTFTAPTTCMARGQRSAAPSGAVGRPLKTAKPDGGADHTPDDDDQQVVSGPG
jgi:hypothetical protein